MLCKGLSPAPPEILRLPTSTYLGAIANGRFVCTVFQAPGSYSGPSMRLILHSLREPPHPGMVPERLNRVVTSLKLCVAKRDVYVSVAGDAQGDRTSRIA